MLQSLIQMQVLLSVFEENCSLLHKKFVTTASHDFLT
jgi:hypothetical protein